MKYKLYQRFIASILLFSFILINCTNFRTSNMQNTYSERLYNAYQRDDINTMEYLLKYGADPNSRYKKKSTLLHFSCNNNEYEITKLLLKYRADGSILNDDDWTPIQTLASKGYYGLIKLFKNNCRALNAFDKNKINALRIAYDKNLPETFKTLLECGAKPDKYLNHEGCTLLHDACYENKTEIAKLLIQYNADIGKWDDNGNTPLHYAISKGYIDILKIVEETNENIDWDIENEEGDTLLSKAYFQEKLKIFEYLLKNGAKPDLWENKDGEILLHWACCNNKIEYAKLLLQFGSNPYIESDKEHEYIPIHYAIDHNNLNIIKLFKTDYENFDWNIKNEEGDTLLSKAYFQEKLKIFECLLENGTKPDLWKNKDGETLLHCACCNNKIEYAKLLLQFGSHPYIKSDKEHEYIPIHYAIHNNNLNIIKLFETDYEDFDWDIQNKEGDTLLSKAYFQEKLEIFEYLLEREANPDLWENNDGETLLHCASCNNKIEYAKLLLQFGSHPYIKSEKAHKYIPIHYAIHNNNLNIIKLFETDYEDFDWDVENEKGDTLLSKAYFQEKFEIFKYLLEREADPDLWRNTETNSIYKGATILHNACYNKRYKYIKALLKAGANLYKQEASERGYIPLHWAAASGDPKVLKIIKKQKPYINFDYRARNRETPLYVAYINDKINTFNYLLKKCGADPNLCKNKITGESLLHLICSDKSKLDFLRPILKKESSLRKKRKDGDGFTPIHSAISANNLEALKIIKEKFPNHTFNFFNSKKNDPLNSAYLEKNLLIFKYLLKSGADPDLWINTETNSIYKGATILHNACYNKRYKYIKALLKAGANLYKQETSERGITPLHWAIDSKDLGVLKTILLSKNFYVNLNIISKKGSSPLSRAYFNESLDIFKFLLEAGADPDFWENKDGESLLHCACCNNKIEYAKLLLQFGSNPYIESDKEHEYIPIHYAIDHNNLNIIKLFRTDYENFNWNIKNENGDTLLSKAYFQEKLKIFEFLLEAGADPDFWENKDREILLHCACCKNKIEYAKLLLQFGSNPYLESDKEHEYIPIHYAIDHNNLNIIKLFKTDYENFNWNIKNEDGDTLLSKAYFQEKLKIFEYLLKNGAYPDLWEYTETNPICKGTTILHNACYNKRYKYIKALLDSGANLYKQETSERGITPLHWAIDSKDLGVLKTILLSKNFYVNLNIISKKGSTPLSRAYFNESLDIFTFLLEAGADPDLWENNKNETLLYYAYNNNKIEYLKALLEYSANIYLDFKKGKTLLHLAAETNNVEILKTIKEICCIVEFDIKDDNNNTPLMLAFKKRKINAFKYLLEKGANPNISNNKNILLHSIIESQQKEYLDILLKKSQFILQINEKNQENKTPLEIAYLKNDYDTVLKLLDLGAKFKFNITNKNNRLNQTILLNKKTDFYKDKSFLNHIYSNGDDEIIKKILDLGHKPKKLKIDNKYLLHKACIDNRRKIVNYLLEEGINPNKTIIDDSKKLNAIQLAAKYGHYDIINLIKEKSQYEIKLEGYERNNPLKLAYKYNQINIIDLLINQYNVNPNTIIFNNFNIFQLACMQNKYQVVKLLLDSNKINLNLKTKLRKITGLQYAIENHCNDIVRLIYDSNKQNKSFLNISFLKSNKYTLDPQNIIDCFYVAINHKNYEGAKYLFKKINLKTLDNNKIKKIIFNLYENKQYNFIEDILKLKIHPDQILNNKNQTLFSISIKDKNYYLGDILLKYGANIDNYRDKKNRTLLKIAYDNKDISKMKKALENNAKINTHKDKYENTILHSACFENRLKELSLLLKYCTSKDLNHQNKNYYTPICFAEIKNNLEIKKIINEKTLNLENKGLNFKSFFEPYLISKNIKLNFENKSKNKCKEYFKILLKDLENGKKIKEIKKLEELLEEEDLQSEILKCLRLISSDLKFSESLFYKLINLGNSINDEMQQDLIIIFLNQIKIKTEINQKIINEIIKIFEKKFFDLKNNLQENVVENIFNNRDRICSLSNKFIIKYIDKLAKEKLENNIDYFKKVFDKKIKNLDNIEKFKLIKFLFKHFDLDIIFEFEAIDWEIEYNIKKVINKIKTKYVLLDCDKFDKEIKSLKKNYSKKEIIKIIEGLYNKNEKLSLDKIHKIFKLLSYKNSKSIEIITNQIQNWYQELTKLWIKTKIESEIKSNSYQFIYSKNINKIISNFIEFNISISLIEKIIDYIKNQADPLNKLNQYLKFLKTNKKEISEKSIIESLDINNDNIKNLQISLLKEKINSLQSKNKNEIFEKTKDFLELECSYNILKNIFNHLLKQNIYYIDKYFIPSLDLVYEYNLSKYDYENYFKKLLAIPPKNWEEETHKYVISKTFGEKKELSFDKIINLIYEKTKNLENTITKKDLKYKYDKVLEKYSKPISNKYYYENYCDKNIEEYKKDDITNISSYIRELEIKPSDEEILAILRHAVKLDKGYFPRIPQLLSTLIFINKPKEFGQIGQINTGEGKSLISSMLAAFQVLKYGYADVITSSPELVEKEIKDRKTFFDLLNISFAHNNTKNISESREVYTKDIVYGTPGKFVGDILIDEYDLDKIRGDRGFKYAIIDEIDNLFYDLCGYITMRSSGIPGMNHSLIGIALANHNIKKFKKGILEKNGLYYYSHVDFKIDKYGNLKVKDKKESIYNYLEKIFDPYKFIKQKALETLKANFRKLTHDEQKELQYIENLNEQESKELEKIGKIRNNREQKIEAKKSDNKFKELKGKSEWKKNKRISYYYIPDYLRKFIQYKIDEWVSNSYLVAFESYKNYKNYTIDKNENEVIHIDCYNTGVLSKNMKYSGGVNQILQIENGLKVKPESLTTRYLSHHSLFKRYGKNIVGMTGTSGKEKMHKLFKNKYNLNIAIIPPFSKIKIKNETNKGYICKELKPVIKTNRKEWITEICKNVSQKSKHNIPSLIICEYIYIAKEIQKILKTKHEINNNLIKSYTGEEKEKFDKRELKSKIIIISTNIAGRGTDLDTEKDKEIEKNAGLFVILTFLPPEERIELQNVGRTARKGNRGISKLIIHDPLGRTIEKLKENRNETSDDKIEDSYKQIELSENKDELFNKFTKLINKLYYDAKYYKYERKSLEERWAIWLNMNENLIQNDFKKAKKKFWKFEQIIEEEHKEGTIIKNPYYHILNGNKYLKKAIKVIESNKKAWWKSNYKKYLNYAIEDYDAAIKLDPKYSFNAYYYKAGALLMKDGKSASEQENALSYLKKLKPILKKYRLEELQLLSKYIITHKNHNAIEQYQHLMNLEAQKISSIQDNIAVLNDTLDRGYNINIGVINLSKILEQEELKYKHELEQAGQTGYDSIYKLESVEPASWLGYIGSILLNGLQFVGGIALVFYTGGLFAELGWTLMYESIGNLMSTTYDFFANGNFNFNQWMKNKRDSLILSIGLTTLFNIKALKDLKSCLKIKAFDSRIAGKTIKKSLFYGGIYGGTLVGSKLLGGTIKSIKQYYNPQIETAVEEKLKSDLEHNQIIKSGINLDKKNKNHKWQNKFIKKAEEVISSYIEKEKNQNKGIGILKGVKDKLTTNALVDLLTTSIETGRYLQKSLEFTDTFIKEFKESLKPLKKEIKKDYEELRKSYLKKGKKKKEKKNHKNYYYDEKLQGFKPLFYDKNTEYYNEVFEPPVIIGTTYIESNAEYLYKKIGKKVTKTINNQIDFGVIDTISYFTTKSIVRDQVQKYVKRNKEIEEIKEDKKPKYKTIKIKAPKKQEDELLKYCKKENQRKKEEALDLTKNLKNAFELDEIFETYNQKQTIKNNDIKESKNQRVKNSINYNSSKKDNLATSPKNRMKDQNLNNFINGKSLKTNLSNSPQACLPVIIYAGEIVTEENKKPDFKNLNEENNDKIENKKPDYNKPVKPQDPPKDPVIKNIPLFQIEEEIIEQPLEEENQIQEDFQIEKSKNDDNFPSNNEVKNKKDSNFWNFIYSIPGYLNNYNYFGGLDEGEESGIFENDVIENDSTGQDEKQAPLNNINDNNINAPYGTDHWDEYDWSNNTGHGADQAKFYGGLAKGICKGVWGTGKGVVNVGKGLFNLGVKIGDGIKHVINDPKTTVDDIYNTLRESKEVVEILGVKGTFDLAKEVSTDIAKNLGTELKEKAIQFGKDFINADLDKKGEYIGEFIGDIIAVELAFGAAGKLKNLKNANVAKNISKVKQAIARIVKEEGIYTLPRSGPIFRTIGAASRSEMLAKRLKLNINSPTTRQVLNSLDDTVQSFISQFRKSSIKSKIPSEFLNKTLDEALRSKNSTVRKLLIDNRFVKK